MAYDLPSLADMMPGIPSLGKKKPQHPALPPEEENSLLSRVLASGSGGLQYIGETLDKPGRAVRGLLAGKPEELANLIPFSDTLGITDPGKSVSGRDLLEQHGLLGENTPGLDWGDVAGFGAEVLTDPTSYLTFGASAVGKAGKVAKAVGISTKGANKYKTLAQHLATATPEIVQQAEKAAVKHGSTLAELSGQKLGGLFGTTSGPLGMLGIKPDFMNGVPGFAQGAKAQAVGQGIAAAPEYLTRKVPLVGNATADFAGKAKVAMKGLFHAPSMGQFTKEGQMAGEFATAGRQSAKAAGELAGIKAADQLDNLADDFHQSFGQQLGTSPQETSKLIRTAAQLAAETRHQGKPDVLGALDRGVLATAHTPGLQQKMAGVVEGLVNQQDNIAAAINAKGGSVAKMFENDDASPVGHFGRFWQQVQNISRKATRVLKTNFGAAVQRSDPIRYVPSPVLNQMMADPALQGLKSEHISLGLLAGYGHDIKRATAAANVKAGEVAAKTGATAIPVEPKDVRDALAQWLSSKQGPGGYGPGTGKFIEDAAVNHGQYMTGAHIADANLEAIHQMFNANLTQGGVPLDAAFKAAGLKPAEAVNYFGSKFGPQALQQGVTPEAVAAAQSFLAKSQKPEWLERIFDAVDFVTQPLKKNLTLPFPSFLTRNFMSGQAMNMMDPTIGSAQDALKYGKSVRVAQQMLDNPASFKGYIDEAIAHNAISRDPSSLGQELGGMAHGMPNPISPRGMLGNVTQGYSDANANVGKLHGALNTPAAIGAKFNAQAEFMNRMPMFHYLREHLGWTPEAAAQKVRDLQIDYSALAPAERDVMKRLIPFYSYMRRSVPMMLDQLAQRPGGTQAQIVRASNTGRSKDEFVPPYIGEGMSVKLGDDTYLSGLGLPTDQYADLFVKGPTALGTIQRTGEKALGMMNPYLKGPLELVTGKNFYTGQDLQDAYRDPTNNVILNQAVHNLPTARYVTTHRQLMDERKSPLTKAANLLTGVKIGDVSGGLNKQRRIAETKILSEMLREHPEISSFTDVFPRKDPKTGQPMALSPEAEKLYRTYHHLQKVGRDEAKKKAKRPVALADL